MLSAETELLGHCVCLDWSQRPGNQGLVNHRCWLPRWPRFPGRWRMRVESNRSPAHGGEECNLDRWVGGSVCLGRRSPATAFSLLSWAEKGPLSGRMAKSKPGVGVGVSKWTVP